MPTAARKPAPPTSAELAQLAHRALAGVARKKGPQRLVAEANGGKGVPFVVPREAFDLFVEVLARIADGNAVTVVSVRAELTTQQAADLLNVSRPYLIGLLDQGTIPSRRVGTHRRVLAGDVLAHKRRDEEQRNALVDAFAALVQRRGLGG